MGDKKKLCPRLDTFCLVGVTGEEGLSQHLVGGSEDEKAGEEEGTKVSKGFSDLLTLLAVGLFVRFLICLLDCDVFV